MSAIGSNDGLGTIGTTTYNYGGGGYYYNNAFDRKLAGFEMITKTDPEGNLTKSYPDFGLGTPS